MSVDPKIRFVGQVEVDVEFDRDVFLGDEVSRETFVGTAVGFEDEYVFVDLEKGE